MRRSHKIDVKVVRVPIKSQVRATSCLPTGKGPAIGRSENDGNLKSATPRNHTPGPGETTTRPTRIVITAKTRLKRSSQDSHARSTDLHIPIEREANNQTPTDLTSLQVIRHRPTQNHGQSGKEWSPMLVSNTQLGQQKVGNVTFTSIVPSTENPSQGRSRSGHFQNGSDASDAITGEAKCSSEMAGNRRTIRASALDGPHLPGKKPPMEPRFSRPKSFVMLRNPFFKLDPNTARRMEQVDTIRLSLREIHKKRSETPMTVEDLSTLSRSEQDRTEPTDYTGNNKETVGNVLETATAEGKTTVKIKIPVRRYSSRFTVHVAQNANVIPGVSGNQLRELEKFSNRMKLHSAIK